VTNVNIVILIQLLLHYGYITIATLHILYHIHYIVSDMGIYVLSISPIL